MSDNNKECDKQKDIFFPMNKNSLEAFKTQIEREIIRELLEDLVDKKTCEIRKKWEGMLL